MLDLLILVTPWGELVPADDMRGETPLLGVVREPVEGGRGE